MANNQLFNEEKDDQMITEAIDTLTSNLVANLPVAEDTSVPVILNPQVTSPYFKISPSGDIYLGNYDGGQGVWWDAQGDTLHILGGLTVDHLDIPSTIVANSFHVDTDGNTWWGATTLVASTNYIKKDGKFMMGDANSWVDWDVTTVDTLTVKGTINATAGYVGASTALVYESTGINVGTTGHIRGSQTDYATGTGFFLGYSGGAYKFSIGSSTQFLTWDGTNLAMTGAVNHLAGTILYQSADTTRSTNGDAYGMRKEILLKQPGTYRIKFTLWGSDGADRNYGRIYKNGGAVGTERHNANTPTEYSEDLAFVAGDLVQLYSKRDPADAQNCSVGNFRIYVSQFDSSTVNTD